MLFRAFAYRRWTLLAVLIGLGLFTGLLEGAFIWVAKSAVNGSPGKWIASLLTLAGLVSLRSLAQILSAHLEIRGAFAWLEGGRDALLRAASLRAIPAYRNPWRNSLITSLGDGLDEAGQGIGAGLRCLAALAHAAVLAPLLLLFSWKLALGALLLGAPALAVSRMRAGMLSRAGKRWSDSKAELRIETDAFAEGLEAEAGNGRLRESTLSLAEDMNRQAGQAQAWETSKAVFPPALEWFFFMALSALALLAGASEAADGAGPGEWLPFGALLLLLYRPIREWARQYPLFLLGGQAFRRLRAAQDAMESFPLRAPLRASGDELAAEGLRFSYASDGPDKAAIRPVFDGLDLRLDPNALTWITGRNGSGKSTLLKLFAGIEFPRSGAIHLPMAWRDQIRPFAYLPQKAWLGSDWSEWARKYRAENPVGWATLDGILGLRTILARAGDGPALPGLSGGERQRLCLARVFASPAPYLLLDEPTTWLTADDRERILGDLLGFWKAGSPSMGTRGAALVSHEPFIGEFCSRTVDMESLTARAVVP